MKVTLMQLICLVRFLLKPIKRLVIKLLPFWKLSLSNTKLLLIVLVCIKFFKSKTVCLNFEQNYLS